METDEQKPPQAGKVDNSRQLALGTKPIGRLLMEYALPSIVAMTATSLYNMVDSIFIGQWCGPMAIAGLAVTFPLMNLSAAFGAMVGVGAGTVVSVKLGQKDIESAENTLGNVVLLNTVIGTIFAVVSLLFLDPILLFFGASDATLPFAREYMRVLLYGNVLTHLYLGLNDVVRSSGYPRKAMLATLSAVVVNCLFDVIFIKVLGLGIAGAAMATLLAQGVAFCVVVHHLTRSTTYIRFKRGIFKWRTKIAKGIISIGSAPFFTNCCACLVVLLINNGLKEHGGDLYIGAYGIVNRIAFVFVMVTNGFNQGMQPIAGYNYGAGNFARSIKVFKFTAMVGVATTSLCLLMALFCPRMAVGLFTDDSELVGISVRAMRFMVAMFPIVGFQIVAVGFLMAMGKAQKAIFLSLTRQLLFLIPFLVFLPRHYGADGVWVSMPLADAISSVLAAILVIMQIRQLRADK